MLVMPILGLYFTYVITVLPMIFGQSHQIPHTPFDAGTDLSITKPPSSE
jgi:hypothetical protein